MEKETSCINSRAIIDYVKAFSDGDCSGLFGDLDPEIDALPDPVAFLRDPNNWISCEVVSRLYERACRILDDDMAPFKMAGYAARNLNLGYAQRIIVKVFWSINKGLRNVQKINDRWNRNKRLELVEMKANSAVLRLHWDPHMASSKHICLYNQGAYSYIPVIWGGKPLSVTEKCCYFEGAPYCEYHLRWPARNRLHAIFSRFFTSRSVLMDTVREMERDKELLERKYDEVNRLNIALNRKIRQLMAIQETGKAILSILDLENLLNVIMSILSNVCRVNRALIMLVNENEGTLEFIQGVGFDGDIPDVIRNYRIPLHRVSNLLARVVSTGKSEYIADVKKSRLRQENVVLTYGQPSSVYAVPLITRSRVIGVLATDAVDGEGVPPETRETMEVFAPQIAVAIENARLYSELNEQMAELRRSQELLGRTEKFSFLGHLAARLAHEIKNPMTAIGTFVQMLPRKFEDREFREQFYEIAMEETARVNNMITELLDLVKKKESHFAFHDLHHLIDRMIFLVSLQAREKNIEIHRRYDPELGQVWLDSEKIKEVILNLLSNAVDFTPREGRIVIWTRDAGGDGHPRRIQVGIKDNGVGIPGPNINRIFDPYFTTRHRSSLHSGTGLGLSIAHQNMQDHGGTIEVESAVNEGTTFLLTLPAEPDRK